MNEKKTIDGVLTTLKMAKRNPFIYSGGSRISQGGPSIPEVGYQPIIWQKICR